MHAVDHACFFGLARNVLNTAVTFAAKTVFTSEAEPAIRVRIRRLENSHGGRHLPCVPPGGLSIRRCGRFLRHWSLGYVTVSSYKATYVYTFCVGLDKPP